MNINYLTTEKSGNSEYQVILGSYDPQKGKHTRKVLQTTADKKTAEVAAQVFAARFKSTFISDHYKIMTMVSPGRNEYLAVELTTGPNVISHGEVLEDHVACMFKAIKEVAASSIFLLPNGRVEIFECHNPEPKEELKKE